MVVWYPQLDMRKFAQAFMEKDWTLDKSPVWLVRKLNRIGRFGAADHRKNVGDQHMVFYNTRKLKQSEYQYNYVQVNNTYGDPQGDVRVNAGFRWISSLIWQYEPPHSWNRLKDDEGKAVRPQAEKSLWYCRMLLAAYTKPKDVVYDGMAGTFSMSLACILTDRTSIACEVDPEVFRHVRYSRPSHLLLSACIFVVLCCSLYTSSR